MSMGLVLGQGTYLIASRVLDAKPKEWVDPGCWLDVVLHALLEAGPALLGGGLFEGERG